MFPNVVSCVDLSAYVFRYEFAVVMNLSLRDVMFVSIKNCICKNFVCCMCVRWWVYVSETRFCFSCEVLPVCFVVVSVGLTVLL